MIGENEADEKNSLRREFRELSRYGPKFEKALDAVLSGGVKENRFVPSGRRILTVVGTLGEEFIDPEKPFCSCGHFFFRVRGGMDELCYHLLGYEIALRAKRIDVIEFSDEEYGSFVRAFIGDIFNTLSDA